MAQHDLYTSNLLPTPTQKILYKYKLWYVGNDPTEGPLGYTQAVIQLDVTLHVVETTTDLQSFTDSCTCHITEK